MVIVMEKEKLGRLQDGINTIMNFSEDEFNKLIEMLTVNEERETEDFIYLFYASDRHRNKDVDLKLGLSKNNEREYLYISSGSYRIRYFVPEISDYLMGVSSNSEEYDRCKRIIATRDFEALKKTYSKGDENEEKYINKIFDILLNDDDLEKFMDYENNKEHFAINGEQQKIEDYLDRMGDIFKYVDDSEGDEYIFIPGMYTMTEDFCVPEKTINTIKDSTIKIYKKYCKDYDRYMDRRYNFRSLDELDDFRIFREEDEPDWNVNEELKEEIYKNMPEDLSLEEKALYIYAKLCKVLEYDEEYGYRNRGITNEFKSDFSKDHLEEIKKGSKITCYDFSRLYTKLINELDGGIEAVIISQGGNRGHFLTGFYTDKVSVRLEAVNIHPMGRKDPTNDIMKAKNGIELAGIQIKFDRQGIIPDALDKAYSLVYAKEPLSIKEFIQELKSIPIEEVPNDIEVKLQAFIAIMKQKGISGNEFVQTLDGMCKTKFFGTEIEKAYIGKRFKQDGQDHIQRMILFRKKGQEGEEKPEVYLINTSSLEVTKPLPQEIIEKIESGEMVYESKEHKFKDIDKGGK